jgi:hypothetical protein
MTTKEAGRKRWAGVSKKEREEFAKRIARARNSALTPERKREIAMMGVEARLKRARARKALQNIADPNAAPTPLVRDPKSDKLVRKPLIGPQHMHVADIRCGRNESGKFVCFLCGERFRLD